MLLFPAVSAAFMFRDGSHCPSTKDKDCLRYGTLHLRQINFNKKLLKKIAKYCIKKNLCLLAVCENHFNSLINCYQDLSEVENGKDRKN